MRPRLLTISGKMKGTEFAVSEFEVSIGREAANLICLDELSVSRRHCLIKKEGDRFFLHDLKSYNGSFVNGSCAKKGHEIKHGDQLGIGHVIMCFLTGELRSTDDFDEGQLVVVQNTELNEESTIRLARQDAVYLSPERLLAELPQSARVTRDLSALLQITSVINSIRDFENLQRRLLELAVGVIPADRAAIILVDKHDLESASYFVWNRSLDDQRNIQVSKTVIDQCLKEPVSILCNDITENEAFQAAESLAASCVRSILCVPLLVFERIIGIVYMDNSNPAPVFDPNHLQLLTGIAEIAARPLENARYIESLKLENQRLIDQLDNNAQIVGESEPIKEVFSLIARIAPTESTVLILGESGTGKELAARAVHQNSERSSKPFVAINCATLTDTLLESELFGHERGAFTGAITTKIGQFELAEGGTMFLDEIGELSPHLQAKLLRVLQEREITRLGGLRPKKIDLRIVAATNRDLEESVRDGAFREDLYYRLNVISLSMPPLRNRIEDIPSLIHHFIDKYNDRCKRNIKGISREASLCLRNHRWAGNVRELENAIERAVILARSDLITESDLPETIVRKSGSGNLENPDIQMTSFSSAVIAAKKKIIQEALTASNGRVTEAAKILAIHPNNLHRLIKELGIRE